MKNNDYLDLLKSVKAKCDRCGSENLLLFVESRIQDCVAWACWNCQHFEIRAKPENIDEYFKNRNDTKRLPC